MPHRQKLPEIYVQPGEWKMVDRPSILRTLLGSCVGITFRAPRLEIAALCHSMLPTKDLIQPVDDNSGERGRYVDAAIREIGRTLDVHGIRREEVEVKLFGGADVLPALNSRARPTIGKLNCESAVRVLSQEGFRLSVSRLRGLNGIHLHFYTDTGVVLLRRIDRTMAPPDDRPTSQHSAKTERGPQRS